ncbi:MAG: hypothetical protein WCK14_12225 [Actinomycetota bacterium]
MGPVAISTSVAPAETSESSETALTLLASGAFEVPAVQGIKDAPGFHEVFDTTALVPAATHVGSGSRILIRFRDRTRPTVTCASEHPLSGCVTLDWSDFPERPRVPAGGAFEQRLTLDAAAGHQDLYLSQSGTLNAQPDHYEPG